MNSEIDFFRIETNHIAPKKGRILIAEPFLSDSYFKRSIIYLTEHNSEGSVGFVINKPVEMDVADVLGDFPPFGAHFSIGGPVSTNTIHYIHTLGLLIPNSLHVADNIYWGGDYEVLKSLIRENAISHEQIRFFLGYSGWTPNQLEEELNMNSWLVAEIEPGKLMAQPSNRSWHDMLHKLGSKYKMWINSPENPGMN